MKISKKELELIKNMKEAYEKTDFDNLEGQGINNKNMMPCLSTIGTMLDKNDAFGVSSIPTAGELKDVPTPMTMFTDTIVKCVSANPNFINNNEGALLNTVTIGFNNRLISLVVPCVADYAHCIYGSINTKDDNIDFEEVYNTLSESIIGSINNISDINTFCQSIKDYNAQMMFATSLGNIIYTCSIEYLYSKGYYIDEQAYNKINEYACSFIHSILYILVELSETAELYIPVYDAAAQRIFEYNNEQ